MFNNNYKQAMTTTVNDRLNDIFEKYINECYLKLEDKDDIWNQNVRAFINYHDDIVSYDVEEECKIDDEDLEEVQEKGFQLFVGEKCANIDEDEFDGPNDISTEEWEVIDNIILYYYLTK